MLRRCNPLHVNLKCYLVHPLCADEGYKSSEAWAERFLSRLQAAGKRGPRLPPAGAPNAAAHATNGGLRTPSDISVAMVPLYQTLTGSREGMSPL